MLNRLLGISVCLAMPSAALAQDDLWITVATDVNDTEWRMHASDIVNDSNYNPEIWIIQDHSKDKSVAHRETKSRYRFDCRSQKYYDLYYAQYRANGTVLNSGEGSSYRSRYAPPGSMIAIAMQYACPRDETEN